MILYTLVPNLCRSSSGLPLVLKDSLGIEGVPGAVADEVRGERGEEASPGESVHLDTSSMYCRSKLSIDPPLGLGGWAPRSRSLDQDGERHHSVERSGQHVFDDMCSEEPLEL